MTAYVGIDLHRRRSLAVCINDEGERLWWKRFENSPLMLAEVVSQAGPDPGLSHFLCKWRGGLSFDVLGDAVAEVRDIATDLVIGSAKWVA